MLDCIYTALYDKYDAQVILCAQETHKGNASVICSRICNKNKYLHAASYAAAFWCCLGFLVHI